MFAVQLFSQASATALLRLRRQLQQGTHLLSRRRRDAGLTLCGPVGCTLTGRQESAILLGHASALLAPAPGLEQVQVYLAGKLWAVLCSSCCRSDASCRRTEVVMASACQGASKGLTCTVSLQDTVPLTCTVLCRSCCG